MPVTLYHARNKLLIDVVESNEYPAMCGPLLLLGKRSTRESRRKAKAVPLSQSCLAPSKNPMHMVIKSTWLPCHLHDHELNLLRRIDSNRSESNKQESGSKPQAQSIHLRAKTAQEEVYMYSSIRVYI